MVYYILPYYIVSHCAFSFYPGTSAQSCLRRCDESLVPPALVRRERVLQLMSQGCDCRHRHCSTDHDFLNPLFSGPRTRMLDSYVYVVLSGSIHGLASVITSFELFRVVTEAAHISC